MKPPVKSSIIAIEPELGGGVYSAMDAAKILKLPYRKVSYWFNQYAGDKLGRNLGINYQFRLEEMRAINFLSLIELYVFHILREKGVKTNSIIEAHGVLSSHFDTLYPFANQNLFTDGGSVLFDQGGIKAEANRSRQLVIWQFLEPYCEKIIFDSSSQVASRFYPIGKDKGIVVDPLHQFGQPTIEGTNLVSSVISDLYQAGEDIDEIAYLYNLTNAQVESAVTYASAA